jgi:two-component sensor histidine kinase
MNSNLTGAASDRSNSGPVLSRRYREQQQLVAREMQHRLRNTLAMLQAIVRQSLRSAKTKDQAEELIGERIAALSKANDLLIEQSAKATPLRRLIARMLNLHDTGSAGRFKIDGPDVLLDQRTSLGLALILHEMATNAAKYGSLSNSNGHVDLTWQVAKDGSGHALSLHWAERGGPAVSQSHKPSFGTQLIECALSDVGAISKLSFPQAGAELNLRVPLPAAVAH